LQRVLQAVIGVDVSGAKASTVRPDAQGQGLPDCGSEYISVSGHSECALRNADLPTRNTNGQPGQRAVAALDLHYLPSFYGTDSKLEPQRVLGSVVRTLHSQPLLTRQMIRDTVTDPAYLHLATSNLADAGRPGALRAVIVLARGVFQIVVVMLQTPYALSVTYSASVVLIEDEITPLTPLPVRERQVSPCHLRNRSSKASRRKC